MKNLKEQPNVMYKQKQKFAHRTIKKKPCIMWSHSPLGVIFTDLLVFLRHAIINDFLKLALLPTIEKVEMKLGVAV